ncbi:hypothetical protein CRG98_014210 [Punica granatum]|uniref:PB1-like domain-containing protein n=1 Tax=Punica granatum TaxID=22663 RepID=A0A2I0KA53_PUNGR|nr:hypothetical protein CRG98_014210 [Punica granatum]
MDAYVASSRLTTPINVELLHEQCRFWPPENEVIALKKTFSGLKRRRRFSSPVPQPNDVIAPLPSPNRTTSSPSSFPHYQITLSPSSFPPPKGISRPLFFSIAGCRRSDRHRDLLMCTEIDQRNCRSYLSALSLWAHGLYTIVLHHGGKFVSEPHLEYVRGEIDAWEMVDIDKLSITELQYYFLQHVHNIESNKKVYWLQSVFDLEDGLRVLETNEDIHRLYASMKAANKNELEFYIDHHLLDDTNCEARLVNGTRDDNGVVDVAIDITKVEEAIKDLTLDVTEEDDDSEGHGDDDEPGDDDDSEGSYESYSYGS